MRTPTLHDDPAVLRDAATELERLARVVDDYTDHIWGKVALATGGGEEFERGLNDPLVAAVGRLDAAAEWCNDQAAEWEGDGTDGQ
jgi:hypothetical protein